MRLPIDFMGKRRWAVGLSSSVMTVSIAVVLWSGLNLGLDFTGGTLTEFRFPEPVSPESVRASLAARGHSDAVVQNLGSEQDMIVRIPSTAGGNESELGERAAADVKAIFPDVEISRTEFVGPSVGQDLREDAGLAILASLVVMCVYLMWRFTGKFAVAALVALVHDVVITVGFFAVFRWTFDLTVVAAVLSVIGYSLNDTIVICDRIRENLRFMRKATLIEVINHSLNQTLERTLLMSGTTLFVLVALLVFGGDSLRGFATALTIGVVVGTYSSIYVAAAYLVFANLERDELAVVQLEIEQAKNDEPARARRPHGPLAGAPPRGAVIPVGGAEPVGKSPRD